MNDVTISKEEASAAARAQAFTIDDAGRVVIHSFLGGFGADWSLAAVLNLIDAAVAVQWRDGFDDHDLTVITAEGRVYAFQVKRPERAS